MPHSALHVSQISWRTTVAYLPTEDNKAPANTAELLRSWIKRPTGSPAPDLARRNCVNYRRLLR
jgi:hypothetical protein